MLLNDQKLRELFGKLGRTYPPGSMIFLEDDRGAEMYIVVSGEVEILKTFKEHELFGGSRLTLGATQETLSILGPGDFFGEMALWNDEPRMAAARAKSLVEVIVLSKADLEQLMMRSPALAIQMMKSICSRLREISSTPRLEHVLPQIQEALRMRDRTKPKSTVVMPTPKIEIVDNAHSKKICETCGREIS